MKHRTVGDVMTTDVATAQRETPFKDLVALLTERGISGVPVTDAGGQVVGVVSQTNLLPRQRQGSGQPLTAAELMARPAHTIVPHASVAEAAELMDRHDVTRLPVVNGTGALVGIVSRRDLLSVFLRSDDEIAAEIAHEVFERNLGVPVRPDTVTISVDHGIATLRGRIDRRSSIPVAESLSARVDGVVGVHSDLTFDFDDTRIPIPGGMTVDITHEPEPTFHAPH